MVRVRYAAAQISSGGCPIMLGFCALDCRLPCMPRRCFGPAVGNRLVPGRQCKADEDAHRAEYSECAVGDARRLHRCRPERGGTFRNRESACLKGIATVNGMEVGFTGSLCWGPLRSSPMIDLTPPRRNSGPPMSASECLLHTDIADCERTLPIRPPILLDGRARFVLRSVTTKTLRRTRTQGPLGAR
jgi:hypothetical protein